MRPNSRVIKNRCKLWGRFSRFGYVILLLIAGCGRPAALNSEEAFSTAEALYTAVTSQRRDLVDDVEMRLNLLQTERKLSTEAKESLDEIIKKTRIGEWQAAAENLDFFIRYQPQH